MFGTSLVASSRRLRAQSSDLLTRNNKAMEEARAEQETSEALIARSGDLCRTLKDRMAALSIASRHHLARVRVLSRQSPSADLCGGTVIIHSDLGVTCAEATCTADNDERWVLANRHLWFISCVDALGPLCPRCAAQTLDQGARQAN